MGGESVKVTLEFVEKEEENFTSDTQQRHGSSLAPILARQSDSAPSPSGRFTVSRLLCPVTTRFHVGVLCEAGRGPPPRPLLEPWPPLTAPDTRPAGHRASPGTVAVAKGGAAVGHL